MTPEQLQQTAAAMTAYAAGKPVQFQIIGTDTWTDATKPEWNCMAYVYRPKPEAAPLWQEDYTAFIQWWNSNRLASISDTWQAALTYERSRTKP